MLTIETQLSRLRETHLYIGCAETLSLVVASAISTFRQKFPHIALRLVSGPSYKIAEETLALKHDISFIYDIEINNHRLRKSTLSNSEKVIFVGSPTIHNSPRKIVSLAEIAEYPLIIGVEGAGSRDIVFREFTRLGLKFHEKNITITGLESAFGLVEGGVVFL